MISKNSIAIIIPGGIGTGTNNIGVPVIEQQVRILSRDFEITVFSLFKVNRDYKTFDFELISITASNRLSRLLKLAIYFYYHHKKKKFSVVHGFWAMPSGFMSVLFGKIYGIRSMVSILGGDAISLPKINYGQLQKWLPKKLVIWTLEHANEVLLTNYLLDNLRNAGLKREGTKILPWGIDTSLFTFLEKPLSTPVRFLHIGNIIPVKDQGTLLRAFKIISDSIPAHLTIIGEGTLEQEIKALMHQLALEKNVTFMPPIPQEQLPSHYHEADILLHTSLSEGHAMVVAEAMGCGVVVCGTNVGLIYDQPNCCVAVPPGDYETLAYEVLRLLKDPQRINMLRRNAHEWATRHSIDWTTKQTRDLYNH